MDEWFGNRQFLRDALLFLDNVLSGFIKKAGQVVGFENAVYSALRERSIGLGVMGFHSYLQQKRIPFESAMAKSHNLRLFKWLHKTAGEINLEVSRERGPCPDARDANIEARWTHMFAVAPTASISIIAGGVSPSVEPWAANVFTQKTLSGSFVVRNPELDALLRNKAMIQTDNADAHNWLDDQWRSIEEHDGSVAHLACLTDDEKAEFRTFMEIDQRWVVSHAADRAGFIDQMASNNLCVPADIWKKELHLLHLKAWREGVKSLYYLRSKSLQRATKVGHMAGEMPQPDEPHRVILVSEPLNANDYESCLACQ
jgi:ribonucleoside-diphosphate reductase alpha chain